MTRRAKYHVTNRLDGRWQTKAEGASRASAVTGTKAEATRRGRELGRSKPLGQAIIHKSNGKIQTDHTCGREPYPPKG